MNSKIYRLEQKFIFGKGKDGSLVTYNPYYNLNSEND